MPEIKTNPSAITNITPKADAPNIAATKVEAPKVDVKSIKSKDEFILGGTAVGGAVVGGLSSEKIAKNIVGNKVKKTIDTLFAPVNKFLSGEANELDSKSLVNNIANFYNSFDPKLIDKEAANSAAEVITEYLPERTVLVETIDSLVKKPGALDELIDGIAEQAPDLPDKNTYVDNIKAFVNTQKDAIVKDSEEFNTDNAFKKIAALLDTIGDKAGKQVAGLVHLPAKAKVAAAALSGLAAAGIAAITMAIAKNVKSDKKV